MKAMINSEVDTLTEVIKIVPEYLDCWARREGITVVGTGDITHPGWLEELKEKVTVGVTYRVAQACRQGRP